MYAKIMGTGSALPEKVVDNFELAKQVDTSDMWIRERTGIGARHIAADDTVASLAAKAAKRAIGQAGMDPDEIDMILVATGSAEQLYPCVACQVQAETGAARAACLDINAACSGFVTAYQMAVGQMMAGIVRTALVIGAECLSNLVDWTDRSTCILFGDGAGAVVLQAVSPKKDGPLINPFVLGADGTRGEALTCHSGVGGAKGPYEKYIRMDGRRIYQFAVKKVPEVIEEILSRSGRSADEVSYFVIHQANRRIIESIARHLKQPLEKFPMNIETTGNVSSASIPVLLDEMNRAGELSPGLGIVLAGFGAGLTWGGTYLEW